MPQDTPQKHDLPPINSSSSIAPAQLIYFCLSSSLVVVYPCGYCSHTWLYILVLCIYSGHWQIFRIDCNRVVIAACRHNTHSSIDPAKSLHLNNVIIINSRHMDCPELYQMQPCYPQSVYPSSSISTSCLVYLCLYPTQHYRLLANNFTIILTLTCGQDNRQRDNATANNVTLLVYVVSAIIVFY